MAQLDLDAIRKQVPAAQGWSDAQLMQYYYTVYAQPRGMSWDTFSKSVGYEPKPQESSWKQDLVNAWAHISRTELPESTILGPASIAQLPVEAAVGVADVIQAGVGKSLADIGADYTATIGSLLNGTQDIPEAAQAIKEAPLFQAMGATLTPEGAETSKLLGEAGKALVKHIPDISDPLGDFGYKHGGPVVGAALKTLPVGVGALLTTSNPLTRALSEYVAEPLQEAIATGTRDALAKSEWGKVLLSSRAAEDRVWKHSGIIQAARMQGRKLAAKWEKLPLTPEDRKAIFDFQEDASGTYPLTDAQKTAYKVLYPYMDDMDWKQGYAHREPLITSSGGAGRLITSLRGEVTPSLTPSVSLAESATHERQMFKLVPVQEVTDTEAAPAAAKSPQTVESEGKTGYMTDAEAERAGIARKVKDIGRSQVAEAEGAEARVNAKLSEWQRQDEEMAARRAGSRPQAPQAAPEGEPPVIAYIHRDDFQPAGQRTVVGIRNGNDFHVGNLEVSKDRPIVGQEITDPTGQRWRVEEASRAEIQKNSRVVYNHDLGVSVARAWTEHQTRVATENLLNDLKTNPDFFGLIQKTTGEDLPGWEKFDSPWLQGYRAPTRLRRTLDTVLGANNLKFEDVGNFINNAMLQANFVINLWHIENVGSIAMSESGARVLDMFNPSKALEIKESWGKAMDQVMNGGEDYLALLKDGFPFMKERTLGPEIYQHTINSLVREVNGPYIRQLVSQGRLDPSTLKYLGDGLRGMLKRGTQNAKYGFDQYEGMPVWTSDDMLKLRAVYARMNRTGENLLTAGRKVKRDFPSYRIRYSTPFQIGPALDFLQRQGLVWFLPYHVDRFAILGRRIGRLATLDPEAAGQLLAQAALLTVVYPTLDDMLKRATDNPNAHMERFGTDRVLSQAAKVASHQAPLSSLLSMMITPSAPVSFISGEMTKKNEQEKSLQQQAIDFLTNRGNQEIYMFQDWKRDKTLQENLRNAFLSQIGVEGLAPPAGHGRYHPYTYQPPRIPNQ